MHSHIVEFLSPFFTHFNVIFYLECHCTAVSEVSEVKSEAQILFKLSRFRKRNTHTVQQTLGITKKKKNLHTLVLMLMFWNDHQWNVLFFLAWHVIESHLLKEESSLIFSAKKLICIGKKFVPQTACFFGSSCNILSRRAQMSTVICMKLFIRTRI